LVQKYIERHADLDWDELLRRARRWHLTVPMAVALRYLADDLAAPIPASVLDRLLAAAGTDTIEREAALFGTRAAPRWSVGRALRASRDWRTRVFVLRRRALPSPRYLRPVETARYSWLPLAYVHRPVRYMARCLRRSANVGVARDHPSRGR